MTKLIMSKALCILPLLFVSSLAHFINPFEEWNEEHPSEPHELFGNPFGDPLDYKEKPIVDDFGTLPITKDEMQSWDEPVKKKSKKKLKKAAEPAAQVDQSGYNGDWELVSKSSGVSSMHAQLIPKINKVLMFDSTIWKISQVQLPKGQCKVNAAGNRDCFAHSVLYDINTGKLTPKLLNTDTWCSSGGLTVDGNIVSTGGFEGGANTARYLDACQNCPWREYPTALAEKRWYSTQAALPDGGYIVVGGRASYSYEYIPAEGQSNPKAYYFDFLKQTTDKDENNLYPFVHLSTDGNVFIFANQRSVLLSPITNQVIKEFPVLPGGHRSYPATGMSVLLPIKLRTVNRDVIPAEVLVCGGSGHKDALTEANREIFYTALQDCGRIRITDPMAVWKREMMPSPRIMGDAVILPTGDVLMLNGAEKGVSGWNFARDPNFKPVLYATKGKLGQRFRELAATTIPRMYHSTSTLLPDGKILVAGSNTNNGYIYNAMFPTELRVEKFSPPYLNAALNKFRPEIIAKTAPEFLTYDGNYTVQIKVNVGEIAVTDVKVTMYQPAFTTHGISMNQRLLDLGLAGVESNVNGIYNVDFLAPPSGRVAPPGYYMLYVVYQGVPSVATWVQIK